MAEGPWLRRQREERSQSWESIRDSIQFPEIDTDSRPVRWRKLGPDGFPTEETQDSPPEQAHSSTG